MNKLIKPYFERQLLEDRRGDGYWIEAFDIDNDSKPDIVGHGLGLGEVKIEGSPRSACGSLLKKYVQKESK